MSIFPTKILLATDGSEEANLAASTDAELAKGTDSELHVVHVGQAASVNPGVTVTGGSLPTEPYESALKKARSLLERQAEQVREIGGSVTETHLRIGQPAYEVVGLSDELGADLLVVGSGRPRAVRRAVSGTMRRAALGSVSDYAVRSARCPVLVVHGDGLPEAAGP